MKRLASLIAARAAGEITYLSDEPCISGNLALRLVRTRVCQCEGCKDREKQRQKASYQSRKEEVLRRTAAYYQKNKEYYVAYQKDYKQRRPEVMKAASDRHTEKRRAARGPKPPLKGIDPLKLKAARRRYLDKYPEAAVEYVAKRRAAIANRLPCWFGELDALVVWEAAALAKRRAMLTGFGWEVDHALPLKGKTVSGLHCAGNIQVIPKRLNRKKRNLMIFTEPLEWLSQL